MSMLESNLFFSLLRTEVAVAPDPVLQATGRIVEAAQLLPSEPYVAKAYGSLDLYAIATPDERVDIFIGDKINGLIELKKTNDGLHNDGLKAGPLACSEPKLQSARGLKILPSSLVVPYERYGDGKQRCDTIPYAAAEAPSLAQFAAIYRRPQPQDYERVAQFTLNGSPYPHKAIRKMVLMKKTDKCANLSSPQYVLVYKYEQKLSKKSYDEWRVAALPEWDGKSPITFTASGLGEVTIDQQNDKTWCLTYTTWFYDCLTVRNSYIGEAPSKKNSKDNRDRDDYFEYIDRLAIGSRLLTAPHEMILFRAPNFLGRVTTYWENEERKNYRPPNSFWPPAPVNPDWG